MQKINGERTYQTGMRNHKSNMEIKPTCLCGTEMITVEKETWQCPVCYGEENKETLETKTN
jgi:hypothetical protein